MKLVKGSRKGVEYTAYKCGGCSEELMTLDQLGSLAEARELIRNSFPLKRYEPKGNQHGTVCGKHFLLGRSVFIIVYL